MVNPEVGYGRLLVLPGFQHSNELLALFTWCGVLHMKRRGKEELELLLVSIDQADRAYFDKTKYRRANDIWDNRRVP